MRCRLFSSGFILTLLPWWMAPAGRPDGRPATAHHAFGLCGLPDHGPIFLESGGQGQIVEQTCIVVETRSWLRPYFLKNEVLDHVNRGPFRGGMPGEWVILNAITYPPDTLNGDWQVHWTLQWRRGGWRDWPGGRRRPEIDFEGLGLR